MESIEIWMWMIAGMIIAGIVFVTSISFLGDYFLQKDQLASEEGFQIITTNIQQVCLGGKNFQTTKNVILPENIKAIYYTPIYGFCMETTYEEDPICNELEVCEVELVPSVFTLQEEQSFFAIVQKSLGKRDNANIKFTFTKKDTKKVRVDWKRELLN